ncbi:uncharacterized protein LOC131071665 isoform X1 [Cryptomeria japonica]|uniref:uncharacterized protein LOC131071665 isoform X1 n=1 Tax=Cryptomeria japonica TaxID=3369 RepID=UPI0025AD29D7|nr:uncharacterized protein LOC131071665 isoform X1 [Cryptomeria japonica]
MGKRTRLHEASRHVDQSTPVKTETKGTKAKGLIEAKNKIPTTRLRSVDQSPEKTPCIIATYESALADSLVLFFMIAKIQLWERELLESAGPSLDEQVVVLIYSAATRFISIFLLSTGSALMVASQSLTHSLLLQTTFSFDKHVVDSLPFIFILVSPLFGL